MIKLTKRKGTFADKVRVFIAAWGEKGEWTIPTLCQAMGLPVEYVPRLRAPVRNLVADGDVIKRVVSGTNNSNFFKKKPLGKPRYISGFTL